ncbi:unnamed protein product [Heligmosomoides polygyrus]|uniref:CASPASE_P20 domain-containing protein n=1 Tax=Heligmosomoides polygyrus TaxID=6339 RepID=A0A183FA01_HELPZ|nr:unnamed protein product [Heligmosomoides polygyrus]
MTYLSEEVGDFPSLLGNISLDVEHDLRPFYAYSRQTTKGYCTTDGRVASHEYLENWRNALLHSKERCHFSMHFMRTLSRGDSDYLSTLDTELRESLEILKANGMFENTVFVVMAGHGNRLKVRDELFTARVEERSPLFSIKLPEKFLRKHFMPKFWMDQNVNRLTTTNDVALTLRDIATMSFVGAKKMDEEEALLGASLLRIGHSYYRSCDDANIPPHLCLCMDEKSLLSEQFKKACNATRKALWAANACRNLTASAIKRLREIDKDSGRKARGIPERPPAIKR